MKANFIFKGNAIFDSVSEKPFLGFVAIRENKIIAVREGHSTLMDFADDNTRIIECEDRLITAGFIDAHMHFFDGIFQNSRFMCRDLFPCKSAAECVATIGAFAKAHPEYERITGMGWFIPLWDDPTPPTKDMLDAIEPDRPVYLMCADGHSFWLNSKALEESKVDPDRKLLFGEIEKNEKGEANGVMHELDACAPCTVNAQRMPEKERIELIIDFVSTLSKNGITATTDMAVLPTAIPVTEELKAVKRLEEEGRFNLRLNLYPPLGTTADFGVVKEYDSLFTSDKLRVAGLKAFVDGVHGNHTALVIEPYNDMPGHCGESFYSHEMYMSQVLAANRAGFGVKLHCCGEGAVEWALDAYENANKQLPNNSVRNSIEHVEALRSEQAIRFTANDVTATMQPLHLMYEGDILDTILGAERAKNQYAIKTMIDEGINVAFSSDYPVAEFNPFINIYFAVTRCDREGNPVEKNSTQAIGVADAIKAYTLGSAYCMGMEQKIGTLEEGKLADILVLDRNLFTSKPQDILDTNVELTMVDGVIAHNDLFKEA